MAIVCLGWGSLVWNPEELIVTGGWKSDGPSLPIEFLRQSRDGRLTLVLDPDPDAVAVPVMWSVLRTNDLDVAIESLRIREGMPTEKPIGRWPSDRISQFADVIGSWAAEKGFKGVVWTALGPRFGGRSGERPSVEEAIAYLRALDPISSGKAADYIRKAPTQIVTPYRKAFVAVLGLKAD